MQRDSTGLRRLRQFCIACTSFWALLVVSGRPCLAQQRESGNPGMADVHGSGASGAGTHREDARGDENANDGDPDMDEVSVMVSVSTVGSVEIPAVIFRDEAYIPVPELFSFLGILHRSSMTGDSISGFFVREDATYLIDAARNRITFRDTSVELGNGAFLRRSGNRYLHVQYFDQVFGLQCTFEFRSLSIAVQSAMDLPAIREMRNLEMRKNIKRLSGERHADTTYSRDFPLFSPGVLDWSVYSTQTLGIADTRGLLALGGMLLGGETRATLRLASSAPVTLRDVSFLWQYADDENSAMRQVSAGHIRGSRMASASRPILGVQCTNAPKRLRKAFGSSSIDEVTMPGWVVELYINDILVDYVKADASGNVHFDVPLVYGTSSVKLRYCGPWGEERIREQNFSIPYAFLPAGEAEYTASAGVEESVVMHPFLRGDVKLGIAGWFTAGSGVEYVSGDTTRTVVPFANVSLALASSLMLTAEYAHGVRFQSTASWTLPSSFRCEAQYRRYAPNQTVIATSYRTKCVHRCGPPSPGGGFRCRRASRQVVSVSPPMRTRRWMPHSASTPRA